MIFIRAVFIFVCYVILVLSMFYVINLDLLLFFNNICWIYWNFRYDYFLEDSFAAWKQQVISITFKWISI